MDWDRAIRRCRGVVLVLLAALPVLAVHAPGPLRRIARKGGLALLRPLESCVRMLVVVLLHTSMRGLLGEVVQSKRSSSGRSGGSRKGSRGRRGFALFAAGERLVLLRSASRKSCKGGAGGRRGSVPDGSAFGDRVAALRAALGDLPAQARRLATALARRGRLRAHRSPKPVLAKAGRWLRDLAVPRVARAFAPP